MLDALVTLVVRRRGILEPSSVVDADLLTRRRGRTGALCDDGLGNTHGDELRI
jgi:hypothetical protein